jgi:Cof subfamily protein (haloacid dehalogenase superfamily)
MATETPARDIALVLSDVDGTLVDDEKRLTPRAQAAVRALGAAGIRFAVTSGRPPRGMAMLVEPLALTTPIAGFNGGVYVDPAMAMLEEHRLSAESAASAMEDLLRRGLDVWVYTGDEWLVRQADAPHVAREEWTVKFPPRVVASFDDALSDAVKLVGVSDDHDLVAQAEHHLQQALAGQASVSRSQPYYLDITHPEANKGAVVGALARRLGIKPAQIATIGDGLNDTLMFRQSGLSIAMGNASDAVKQAAHHVTDRHDSDGFAKAVEQFLLAGRT